MIALGLNSIVFERVLAEAVERDRAQEAGRNDPVGVDVVPAQHARASFEAVDRSHSSPRTSTT